MTCTTCLTCSNDVKKEKNALATQIFKLLGHRALDFGLELTYIIEWMYEKNICNKLKLPVGIKLMRKVMTRKTLDEEIKQNKSFDGEVVDEKSMSVRDIADMKFTLEQITGREVDLNQLVEGDRRTRHRMIGRLKDAIKEYENG